MFKQNKDLYNRYINERNRFIRERYGDAINIEDFLKNEPIEEKYYRFFIRMFFTTTCYYEIDNKNIRVKGLGDFIYDDDEYGYGVDATIELITLVYGHKDECLYDSVLQEIEEYRKIDIEKFERKHDDDEAVIYYYGQSLETYLNTFKIDSNEKLIKTLNQQITSYLNYIGLTVNDL